MNSNEREVYIEEQSKKVFVGKVLAFGSKSIDETENYASISSPDFKDRVDKFRSAVEVLKDITCEYKKGDGENILSVFFFFLIFSLT